ncbi:MAG: S1C family serine protease [Verrucomicrobiota bacterium]
MILCWRFKHFLIICLLVAIFLNNGNAQGVFDSISKEVNKIFEAASPSVVKVRALSGTRPRAGTGFFIDNSGTLLTSYAIILDSNKAWVEYQDKKFTAKVLGKDPRSGVALLKIDAQKTPFLTMGDSDQLKMASGLVSVAYPYNLPLAPAFGFVTGFDVRYLNRFFATTHIRANVAISPGQIGGPLLNTKGEVVGLMVLAVQKGKECYALPMTSVKRIISDFEAGGEARHGWVGVGVVEGPVLESGERPVVVSNLFRGTPAAESGLQPGDIVKKIGKKPIQIPSDILDAAFFSEVGKPVEVQIVRKGKKLVFDLPIVERPEESAAVNSLIAPGRDTLIAPFVSPEPKKSQVKPVQAPATQSY